MDIIEKFKKVLFNTYFFIGVSAMAIMAVCVIFSVIARYFFSLSWKQLAEFNVTCFVFTTFWSMGLCVLKGEHVMIDIFYDGVKPALKRWLSVLDYIILLGVDVFFTFFAWKYTKMAGIQISQGMEIPMIYMYGIMPISGIICAICTIIKIFEVIKAPIEFFNPVNKELKPGDDYKETKVEGR